MDGIPAVFQQLLETERARRVAEDFSWSPAPFPSVDTRGGISGPAVIDYAASQCQRQRLGLVSRGPTAVLSVGLSGSAVMWRSLPPPLSSAPQQRDQRRYPHQNQNHWTSLACSAKIIQNHQVHHRTGVQDVLLSLRACFFVALMTAQQKISASADTQQWKWGREKGSLTPHWFCSVGKWPTAN